MRCNESLENYSAASKNVRLCQIQVLELGALHVGVGGALRQGLESGVADFGSSLSCLLACHYLL